MKKYIYTLNYAVNERDLSLLETRTLFSSNITEKTFFSNDSFNPSHSPFFKGRLEILKCGNSFQDILEFLENERISSDEFKAEYFKLQGEEGFQYEERNSMCREIGLRIQGFPWKSQYENGQKWQF